MRHRYSCLFDSCPIENKLYDPCRCEYLFSHISHFGWFLLYWSEVWILKRINRRRRLEWTRKCAEESKSKDWSWKTVDLRDSMFRDNHFQYFFSFYYGLIKGSCCGRRDSYYYIFVCDSYHYIRFSTGLRGSD